MTTKRYFAYCNKDGIPLGALGIHKNGWGGLSIALWRVMIYWMPGNKTGQLVLRHFHPKCWPPDPEESPRTLRLFRAR